jgi:dipeptidyl aminopeptidase/acylaminoacyl peptidase
VAHLFGVITWSLDGRQFLVSASGAGNTSLGETGTWHLRSLGNDVSQPQLEPGMGRIAFERDDQLWVSANDGSNAKPLTLDPFGGPGAWAWSPQGGRIAMTRADRLRMTTPEREQDVVVMLPMDASNFGWSPDGSHIAVEMLDEPSQHWVTAVVAADSSTNALLDNANSPLWSSDGHYLAVIAIDSKNGQSNALGIDVTRADGAGRSRVWSGADGPAAIQSWMR